MKKDYTLYASALPLFMLLLSPSRYAFLLPINLLITAAAVYYALKTISRGTLFRSMWKKELWLAWLSGFAGDLSGAGVLLGLTAIPVQNSQSAWGLAIAAIQRNPFTNTTSSLLVFLSILLAAAIKYLLDLWIAFRKTDLPLRDKRMLCLSIAMLTAPYTFLLPAAWLSFLG